MAKFCPECAHPIIDGNSQFCPKCGARLPITSPEVQPPSAQQSVVQQPTHLSYYTPVSASPPSIQTPVQQQQYPIVESPTQKRSTFEWIAICCGGVILLVIASAFLSSLLSGINPSNSKDELITQDLSSMALTINDMPTGWQGSGSLSTSGDTYSASFVNPTAFDPEVVSLKVQKFSTVEQAKTTYNSRKAKNPNLKMESINIGNEGFGYVNVNDIFVIFRKGNILVTIEDVKSPYSWSLNLDDATNYAKVVANRIK